MENEPFDNKHGDRPLKKRSLVNPCLLNDRRSKAFTNWGMVDKFQAVIYLPYLTESCKTEICRVPGRAFCFYSWIFSYLL